MSRALEVLKLEGCIMLPLSMTSYFDKGATMHSEISKFISTRPVINQIDLSVFNTIS
jgi:hypothetical protein